MTRPLLWALGVMGSACLSAVTFPERATRILGLPPLDGSAPVAASAASGRTLVLQADYRGHFIAHVGVNGAVIRALVDTGASLVALSAEDAVKAGVTTRASDRRARFSTANGVVEAPVVRLASVEVGGIVVRDVEAAVMPHGVLEGTLLGMSFLRALAGFEVAKGRLVIKG